MIRLSFSEEEVKELDYQRYHHPHPRVQKKMEVLLLKARGLSTEQIAHCVGICQNTVRSYLREYESGGMEELKQVRFRQPESELQAHKSTLEAHFQEHPPTSIAQAAKEIEQLTGIKRSEVQVGIFIKKMGLKRLKTYAIPAKCNVEEQETLKKRAGASLRGGKNRQENGLFCGCGALCAFSLSWLSMVFYACFSTSTQWKTAFQCIRSPQCGDASAHHRDK